MFSTEGRPSTAAKASRMAAAFLATLFLLVGCGGGGGGGGAGGGDGADPEPPTPQPVAPQLVMPDLPASGTALVLAGSADHPVTKGKGFRYTQASARLMMNARGASIRLEVMGDERWVVSLSLPLPAADLSPGVYRNLPDLTAAGGPSGYFAVESIQPQATCTTSSSDVTVESVSLEAGRVSELTMSFEQRCNGSATALSRGRLRWQAGDSTVAPGPVSVPGGLWQPPAGTLPASGNYIYLESQAGDPIGQGGTQLLTQADAWIFAEPAGPRIKFQARGDRRWLGSFQAMDSLTRLQPGYYDGLLSNVRGNPRRGAVEWMTGTERCDQDARGWIAIDAVSYRGDALSVIELRFEQRCANGTAPPLRGKIRWADDDATLPPGPQAVPPTLWRPPAAALPATGNFVYLQSENGDWVGQGQTLLITPNELPFVIFERQGQLSVSLGEGLQRQWFALFQGDYTQRRLERGHYAGLLDISSFNPARGAMNWSGQGRGCAVTGWFVVDNVRYTRGVLRSIDLRFEQACKGSDKALRGMIHWVTDDPVLLAEDIVDGPLPPRAAPFPTEAPLDGRSFVQLESGADDFVGARGRYLYTKADARLSVNLVGHRLQIGIQGRESWLAELSVSDIPPGAPSLPPGVGTYPVPIRASIDEPGPRLSLGGEGRGCGSTHGSFTIERISIADGIVQVLDLSLEQYCDNAYLPLRGRIHWDAADPTQPAAPVWPAPAELWRLPDAFVPANGNYLFVHSPTGEFVGGGVSRLFTSQDANFGFLANQDEPVEMRIERFSAEPLWRLQFGPAYNVSRLAPGLYPFATRAVVGNPASGRMAVSGEARGCNILGGWFAVDAITYVGNEITALDLRFEQYCEGEGPPLRGQLRWRR